MERIILDQDIRPLSEFRSSAASCIKQISNTKRPMILTQRGRGVAVLIDIHEFEQMKEKMELFQDIQQAENQIAEQQTFSHEKAKTLIKTRINR